MNDWQQLSYYEKTIIKLHLAKVIIGTIGVGLVIYTKI